LEKQIKIFILMSQSDRDQRYPKCSWTDSLYTPKIRMHVWVLARPVWAQSFGWAQIFSRAEMQREAAACSVYSWQKIILHITYCQPEP